MLNTERTYHAYDRALTLLFSHPIMMESLIKGFVPQPWTKALDFSSLRTINVKHTTEQLRRRENDVIWAINLKGQTIYIICILEFQSDIDKFMAVRLMTYIGLTYQELIMQEPNALVENDLLPPVFSLVLYTGAKPWNAPKHLIDCLSTRIPKSLLKYQPSLEYMVLDIGHLDLDGYNISNPNIAATFIELEKVGNLTQIQPIVDKLILQLQSERFDSLRRAFVAYINRAWRPKKRLTGKEFVDLNEVKTMLREKFEKWEKEKFQEGWQEGRQELQETTYQNQLKLLLKILEHKFPTAPDSVKKTIQAMPFDALSELIEKIAIAKALEELIT